MIDLAPRSRRSFVRLLEFDPELAAGLDGEATRRATKYLLAGTTSIPAGPWEPDQDCPSQEARALGLFVIDGLLTRRVEVPGGSSLELIGPGDVIRPWDGDREGDGTCRSASWCALGTTEVACLDHEFATVAAHWPEVAAALIRRTLQRADALSCHLAISHIVGVEMRILRLLGHLAERWGRVTRVGVIVPVPLTNEMIGTIIGARAPSVSTAFRKLVREKLLARRPDGTWLLQHGVLASNAVEARPRPAGERIVERVAVGA